MSFLNNGANGISYVAVTAMTPIPGSNTAPNCQGIVNHPNYYLCGGPEQTVSTTRTSTIDAGSALGTVSGTHSAKMDPIQGSSKLFVQGSPVTGSNDMSMTNNFNAPCTQTGQSQIKAKKCD